MFDTETARIIQQATPLDDLDLDKLPQFLTEAYAKLVAARLGAVRLGEGRKDEEWSEVVVELRRIADTYEALSIFLPAEDPHHVSCAFVAASAHHTLSQARRIEARLNGVDATVPSLSTHGVGSEVAACLLFLIAGQQADAAETAKLFTINEDEAAEAQLLHGIAALASGDGQQLSGIVHAPFPVPSEEIRADYLQQAAGFLWWRLARAVQVIASDALGQSADQDARILIQDVLNRVEQAQRSIVTGGIQVSVRPSLEGPYHLARLLLRVSELLAVTSVFRQEAPHGIDNQRWQTFTRSFAARRPFLWRNHITAFENGFLNAGRSSVLTFPTGAGKTTITELRIAAELLRDRKVVYLAPTRALVDQVSRDLSKTLLPVFPQATVRGRFLEDFGEQAAGRVFVHTPEQCLAYLSFDPDAHTELGLIVVDECHQLSGELPGPDGKQRLPGRRSVDAMWTLLSLINRSPQADVVLISAMVKNGQELAQWLQATTNRPATVLDLPWKPTRQIRGVVVYEAEEIDRLEETLHGRRQAAFPRKKPQKSERGGCAAQPKGLFCHSQVWATNSTFAKFPILPASVPLTVSDYWGLTANRNEVGGMLLGSMARAGMRPIVFSQQIDWTTKIAEVGAAEIESFGLPEVDLTPSELALFDAAAAELGKPEHVQRPIRNRVGVHHGLLLWSERLATESAFRRVNGLLALVATPTVAQGINLPAEAVVIAGDDRWVGDADEGGMQPLAVHELLNAAGRAGRAGHYAHGIVIDLPGKVLTVEGSDDLSVTGLDHIMSLFGLPDQCLDVVDPLTQVLDMIQTAGADAEVSKYLVRRAAGLPGDALATILGNALGNAFHERRVERAVAQAALLKNAALRLDDEEEVAGDVDLEGWREFASRVGVSTAAVATIATRIPAPRVAAMWSFSDLEEFATSEVVDQLFALVGRSSSGLARVMPRQKDKASGGAETILAWQTRWQLAICESLPLWLAGKPIADIGDVLHRHRGATKRVKAISLGRRFSLQVVNGLAHGASVVAHIFERVRGKDAPLGLMSQLPLLAGCIREGFEDPDMLLLFWRLRSKPGLFPRVMVHQVFETIRGRLPAWSDGTTVEARRALVGDACRAVGL